MGLKVFIGPRAGRAIVIFWVDPETGRTELLYYGVSYKHNLPEGLHEEPDEVLQALYEVFMARRVRSYTPVVDAEEALRAVRELLRSRLPPDMKKKLLRSYLATLFSGAGTGEF